MNPDDFMTGGGAGGLLAAVAFVIIQIIKSRSEKSKQPSGAITDASTANAVLRNSLDAEQDENTRLRERLTTAERRIDQLQQALETERETHRTELRALHRQLDDLARRLAAAEARYEKEIP